MKIDSHHPHQTVAKVSAFVADARGPDSDPTEAIDAVATILPSEGGVSMGSRRLFHELQDQSNQEYRKKFQQFVLLVVRRLKEEESMPLWLQRTMRTLDGQPPVSKRDMEAVTHLLINITLGVATQTNMDFSETCPRNISAVDLFMLSKGITINVYQAEADSLNDDGTGLLVCFNQFSPSRVRKAGNAVLYGLRAFYAYGLFVSVASPGNNMLQDMLGAPNLLCGGKELSNLAHQIRVAKKFENEMTSMGGI
jgi:hypothetical protein